MRRSKRAWLAALVSLAACGGGAHGPERAEIGVAGGRVSGGKYVVTFQVGHGSGQGRWSGGTMIGTGAETIKP